MCKDVLVFVILLLICLLGFGVAYSALIIPPSRYIILYACTLYFKLSYYNEYKSYLSTYDVLDESTMH